MENNWEESETLEFVVPAEIDQEEILLNDEVDPYQLLVETNDEKFEVNHVETVLNKNNVEDKLFQDTQSPTKPSGKTPLCDKSNKNIPRENKTKKRVKRYGSFKVGHASGIPKAAHSVARNTGVAAKTSMRLKDAVHGKQ